MSQCLIIHMMLLLLLLLLLSIYTLKITIDGFSCQIIFTGLAIEFAIQRLTVADLKS